MPKRLPRIRVLIADLPRMLSDIVSRVVKVEADLELVGQTRGREQLMGALDRARADVVVLGTSERELSGAARHIFQKDIGIRILAIVSDGREAFLYRLQPHKKPIGQLSPSDLVRAIRTLGEEPREA